MALLVAGAAGISVDTLDIDDLLEGDPILTTSTAFTLKDGDWLEEFQGQFTYSSGELAGGAVTAWKESFQGEMVFQVSDFSVPVTTFVNWANTSDNEAVRSTILGGADTITGSGAADGLKGYAGNDVIRGGDGANFLRGDEGNDSILGGSGFDDIHGNMGNDTGSGGLGDDWVVGGKDEDLLFGDAGNDIVYGNMGADTCDGGDGADVVRGGQANDTISGGAGDDFLSGDRGDDTISGGAGADIFNTFADAGLDRVLDFNLAQGDRVQLEAGTQHTVAQVGADTVISMNGGGQMVLVGVQLSSLGSDWIIGG
jgi:RTX toxins and related Ca2+-binding proteins